MFGWTSAASAGRLHRGADPNAKPRRRRGQRLNLRLRRRRESLGHSGDVRTAGTGEQSPTHSLQPTTRSPGQRVRDRLASTPVWRRHSRSDGASARSRRAARSTRPFTARRARPAGLVDHQAPRMMSMPISTIPKAPGRSGRGKVAGALNAELSVCRVEHAPRATGHLAILPRSRVRTATGSTWRCIPARSTSR